MKLKSIAKIAGAMALTMACMIGVAGCNTNQVAATVNGVSIAEKTITDDIEALRSAYGLTDSDTWAQYMSYYGYTPSTIRETMINSYVEQEIIKEEAKAQNLTVDSSEVDTYVNSIKAYYSDDAAWKSALESAGLTEEKYRENIEQKLLEQQLMDKVAPVTEASDEDVLSYAQMYCAYSFDGAKKSSHILFDASDTETAQKVLDQINAGTLTFEDAAKQYSKDSSASNGGNVGWDCLNSFVTAYTTALAGLDVDQVSGLVTSEYGIHIIKCTEKFTSPEDGITDLSQVPSEMLDSIKSSVTSYSQQSAFSTWLEEKVSAADVKINDMPKGLSYDVDMSKYQTSNTTDTTNTNTEATDNANNASNAENTNNTNNTNSGSSN